MSVKTQRVRRTPEMAREEIIDALEVALAEGDFADLTVDGLMRHTGMTRSSFYHYFASLEDVVIGLLERMRRSIGDTVDLWLSGSEEADYIAATQAYFTKMFEVMSAQRIGARALVQTASSNKRIYEVWRERLVDDYIAMTSRFIRQQIRLGRSEIKDPDTVARALILMNAAVANDSMMHAEHDDPALLAATCAGIWNATIYGTPNW